MGKIILFVAIIAAFAIVVEIFFPGKISKRVKIYQYRRKEYLISKAEHEFFNILTENLGDKYFVFPQIHLSTFLDNKVVGQDWHGALRHIDEKSVDFVICDKVYIKPLLAIEVDDKSHDRSDRRARDIEVEGILKEAGFPLLRFENHGQFDRQEISKQILEILQK